MCTGIEHDGERRMSSKMRMEKALRLHTESSVEVWQTEKARWPLSMFLCKFNLNWKLFLLYSLQQKTKILQTLWNIWKMKYWKRKFTVNEMKMFFCLYLFSDFQIFEWTSLLVVVLVISSSYSLFFENFLAFLSVLSNSHSQFFGFLLIYHGNFSFWQLFVLLIDIK